MKTVSLILLSIIVVAAYGKERGPSGFIVSSRMNTKIAGNTDTNVYTDSDLQNLILHNIGLLSSFELSESSKKIISKYGESTLSKKTLLNYLFLIDTDRDVARNNLASENSGIKVDLCNNSTDLESCVLGLLYNKDNQNSLVNQFESFHQTDAQEGVFYYGSDEYSSSLLKDVSFSLDFDKKGNVLIVKNKSGKTIALKKSLESCVQNILGNEFIVDLKENAIFSKNQESAHNSILLSEDHTQLFQSFLKDVCAVVSLSEILRKDSTPSLFTFYINSLGKIEKVLNVTEKHTIHYIWNKAYTQFNANLNKNFGQGQVSGQVIPLENSKSIEVKSKERLENSRQNRNLADSDDPKPTPTPTPTPTPGLSKQNLIFRIFGVGFVIVLALILVSMASIEVQKDSLVYAKFLAPDQRK